MKSRYKVGDRFPATVVIESKDEFDDDCHYLKVEELDSQLEDLFTQEQIDMAFNPAVRIAAIKKQQETLEKELKKWENRL